MDRDTFLSQLRASRLLAPDLLQLVELRFAADETPGNLADSLVAEGILTPFQAGKVLAADAHHLQLGPYRLLDELGRGGMGQVFKAQHTVMGRIVALKVLSPTLRADPQALRWFEREVRLITQLQHPNIALAYDANEVDGLLFLVLEYVEGRDLRALVKKQGPLPIGLACTLMFEAALGLQYGHEQGMVHRDVKPANLLIPDAALAAAAVEGDELRQRPPLVKIVDFGLARLCGASAPETLHLNTAQNFAGTPDFVSPEQCQDIHSVDIRSDLYSLGCTFFFALTGHAPFEEAGGIAKLTAHLLRPPPPIEERRPDVPAAVAAVVHRLLAKDPEQRFATPLELAQALRPWCALPAGEAARPSAPPGVRIATSPESATVAHRAAALPQSVAVADPDSEVFLRSVVERALPEQETRRSADQVVPASLPETARADAAVSGASTGTVELPAALVPAEVDETAAVALCDAWRAWTDVVAACVSGPGHVDLDEAAYGRLYRRLLVICRQAADGGTGATRAFFLRLEETVRPWMRLAGLERTDPEILGSLLARCRQAEGVLGVRRPLERLGGWLHTWAGPALIVVLLVLWARSVWVLWLAAGAGSRRLPLAALLAGVRAGSLPELLVVGLPALIVAVLGFLLCRR